MCSCHTSDGDRTGARERGVRPGCLAIGSPQWTELEAEVIVPTRMQLQE